MSDTYPRLSSYPTFIKVIVILAPPLRVAYPFILDVASYPLQVIDLFIVLVCVPCLSLSLTTSHRPRTGTVLSPLEEASFTPAIQRHFYLTAPWYTFIADLSNNVVWTPLALFFLLVECFRTLWGIPFRRTRN